MLHPPILKKHIFDARCYHQKKQSKAYQGISLKIFLQAVNLQFSQNVSQKLSLQLSPKLKSDTFVNDLEGHV